jgi:Protein of unknown function (DUF2637)
VTVADRVIAWSTAGAVVGVAAVAAVASHEHAYDLMRAHGESGWAAHMVPLTVDGLQAQAAEAFADEPAAGQVPSGRTIRARLHVGQPRAQLARAYLTALIKA